MASAALDRVITRVQGLKQYGREWKAKCPAHDDKVASLSIGIGTGGRILVHCHAGCAPSVILDALNLTLADLFPEPPEKAEPSAVYPYKAADGHVLYEVCRFFPKDFRQRRPDGHGGWVWNLIGVEKVPYRLPELQDVSLVCIVEGEKDADKLWSYGIPATTNAGGAGKWKQPETAALRRAGCQRVVILPDNDDPGRKHADQVAEWCRKAGMAVTRIDLPGLVPHGDVSDWLADGHTPGELLALMKRPYIVPSSMTTPLVAVDPETPAFDPDQFRRSDLGNAEAFIHYFGDRVRWDRTTDSWLVWGEHTWHRGADLEVRCFAHELVRMWAHAANGITDWVQKKQLMDYALKLERSAAFDNLLKEARAKPTIAVKGGFDEQPMLLGTPNGVIDLTTGAHRPGQQADMVTKMTGPTYDPDATCERWNAFLVEVFDGDLDVVRYVQRAVGYCLTAHMSEQCFFMAYGSGANGKSTFLVTLDHVFGDYAHTSDIRTFTHSGDGPTYELAQLGGKRLIATSEAKTRSHLNEQILKNFTGGERIEAQHKYGHPFMYKPTGKIWFAVNHRPKVDDESPGFWRRVRMVPFMRTFSGSADDRTLTDKLRTEAAGILNWAVAGCLAWQAEGLNPPEAVAVATAEYQAAEDPITDFLNDRCVLGVHYRVQAKPLYTNYTNWAKETGVPGGETLSGKAFGERMMRLFSSKRDSRANFYYGIALRTDDAGLEFEDTITQNEDITNDPRNEN